MSPTLIRPLPNCTALSNQTKAADTAAPYIKAQGYAEDTSILIVRSGSEPRIFTSNFGRAWPASVIRTDEQAVGTAGAGRRGGERGGEGRHLGQSTGANLASDTTVCGSDGL